MEPSIRNGACPEEEKVVAGLPVEWPRNGSEAGGGSDDPCGAVLGDFRILRQIGKGGMGIVYEAEQISLGRRVAVKVLPLAATLDPRSLQRFRNEARAAAGLNHPHIVPVYAVGSERGIHFYAMQLIDGQPLSQLILRQREARQTRAASAAPAGTTQPDESDNTTPYPPASEEMAAAGRAGLGGLGGDTGSARATPGQDTFRTIAQLGIQAAEALDYAHQLGIVHRDVKPGNLLLDTRGQVWVADFGLAQMQAGEAGLTQTGDLLGTLRYMSPEQAVGKRAPIDHRTDVYSLGVTLYELLTLQPVFTGDRQELLRQIAMDDPVPPRRWEKALPTDLETIVLKAMEKRDQDRYATAQELADDLRRFLQDQPIRARRHSWAQWTAKWMRRHRAVTAAAAACLAVAVAALAVSTAVIAGAYGRTHTALEQEKQAREDLQREEEKARLALERERQSSYAQSVLLAHLHMRDHQGERAQEVLQRCPEDLRGWEWYHLNRLCHAEKLSLRGHTGPVRGVAFSPDGRLLASASHQRHPQKAFDPLAQIVAQGEVKVWDVARGKEVLTLPRAHRSVETVAFSPDGRLLATAGSDHVAGKPDNYFWGSVRIWEVATGKEVRSFLKLGLGVPQGIAFSPDGQRLVAGGLIHGGKVWDLHTGKEPITLEKCDGSLCVAWSPDGQSIVGGSQGRLIVWDAASGKKRLATSPHTGFPIYTLAFSPDGQRVAGSSGREIKMWNVVTGQEVRSLWGHTAQVAALAFSHDSKRLASADFDHDTVRLWNADSGEEILALCGHSQGYIAALAFRPDNQHLASCGMDGTVKLWDSLAPPGGSIQNLPAWDGCVIGSHLRIACSKGGGVQVKDARSGKSVFTAPRLEGLTLWPGGAFSRDETYLAAAFTSSPPNVEGGIKVWDVAANREVFSLSAPGHFYMDNAFSPDGRFLASAVRIQKRGAKASVPTRIQIWDLKSNTEVRSFAIAAPLSTPGQVVFAPDWKRVACLAPGKSVTLHDMSTGQELHTLAGLSVVRGLIFSPDGKLLAGHTQKGEIHVHDVATGEEVFSLREPGLIDQLAFTPDGKRLATLTLSHSGEWKMARLTFWSVSTRQALLSFQVPHAERMAFDADRWSLLLLGQSGRSYLWDDSPRDETAAQHP